MPVRPTVSTHNSCGPLLLPTTGAPPSFAGTCARLAANGRKRAHPDHWGSIATPNRAMATSAGATLSLLVATVVYRRLFDKVPGAQLQLPSTGTSFGRAAQNAKHPSGATRRQFIARCRVLRSEIRRFEDDFEQHNARKPTTALDRHPLAGSYAEYRKLKVYVRGECTPTWIVRRSVPGGTRASCRIDCVTGMPCFVRPPPSRARRRRGDAHPDPVARLRPAPAVQGVAVGQAAGARSAAASDCRGEHSGIRGCQWPGACLGGPSACALRHGAAKCADCRRCLGTAGRSRPSASAGAIRPLRCYCCLVVVVGHHHRWWHARPADGAPARAAGGEERAEGTPAGV